MLELHVLHVSCVDTEPVEAEHDSRAYNYIDTSMSFNSYAGSFPAQGRVCSGMCTNSQQCPLYHSPLEAKF
ncbi:hypothetical protein ISN45_Aa01g004820 [Arabidopsis thaliana x Arabidopsis arenosa]|uniref:Uncharacterized protein n=1 Tax=Arabidopsis thaliana x Arabidopsis arenosa TaxID=1240361 RepID=A0A8T2BWW9_9BRAS|nr:hypothetical protein ISN45_Aa01g004820 [Arabidopsis thaliana x Arabidopsis arenosa]